MQLTLVAKQQRNKNTTQCLVGGGGGGEVVREETGCLRVTTGCVLSYSTASCKHFYAWNRKVIYCFHASLLVMAAHPCPVFFSAVFAINN